MIRSKIIFLTLSLLLNSIAYSYVSEFPIQEGLTLTIESDITEDIETTDAEYLISRLKVKKDSFDVKIATSAWTEPMTVEEMTKKNDAIAGINGGFFHAGDATLIQKFIYTQTNTLARLASPFLAPAALLIKDGKLINQTNSFNSVLAWNTKNNTVLSGEVKVDWFVSIQDNNYDLKSVFYNPSTPYSLLFVEWNKTKIYLIFKDKQFLGYSILGFDNRNLIFSKDGSNYNLIKNLIQQFIPYEDKITYQSFYEKNLPSIFKFDNEAIHNSYSFIGLLMLDESYNISLGYEFVESSLKTSGDWSSMEYVLTGTPLLISNGEANLKITETDFPDSKLRQAVCTANTYLYTANNYVSITNNYIQKMAGLVENCRQNPTENCDYKTERTTVCVTEKEWILSRYGVCSHISPAQFIEDHKAMGCLHAIVLDGGPSSELFINAQNIGNEEHLEGLKIGKGRLLIDSLLVYSKE